MKTKIASLKHIALLAAAAVAASPAVSHAGVLRYFLHGGMEHVALGGVSLLDPGTSDLAIGQPALEVGRPQTSLRMTYEYEDILRATENGAVTGDISARNAQRELVFTKSAPGRSVVLLAQTQDVHTSTLDMKEPGYSGSRGNVEAYSVGMRFGNFAIGGGHTDNTSDTSGLSEFLRNDLFDSTRPPDFSAPADQPEKFLEAAAFPMKGVQVFYKRVWGERNATLSMFGIDTDTGAWSLSLPFTLDGGGRSAGFVAPVGRNLKLTFVDTKNHYGGRNSARLDYAAGVGSYDPFGLYTTIAKTESDGVELEWRRSDATRLLFGYQKSVFEGIYDGMFVSVPTGYYNVDAYVKMRPGMYHIGYEKEGAFQGVDFRTGLQYGELNPEGYGMTVGASCPFLVICNTTDTSARALPYTSITQRILTMGLSYKIGSVEAAYTIGQMVPKSTKRPDENAAPSTGGTSTAEPMKKAHGGTIHLFSLQYEF